MLNMSVAVMSTSLFHMTPVLVISPSSMEWLVYCRRKEGVGGVGDQK